MRLLESGVLAALLLTGTACGAAVQHRSSALPTAASCGGIENLDQQVARIYDTSRIRHAAPLYRTQFLARAIQPRYVAGAELYLDAEPGFSQPYLERVLGCHAAAAIGTHPNDPLGTQHIRDVSVRTSGDQFVVAVTGADRHTGNVIWQKAKALVEPASRVEIQQLSAAQPRAPQM